MRNRSYIDDNISINHGAKAWLATTEHCGHAYLFLEYMTNPSCCWRLFGYRPEQVVDMIDFIPGYIRCEKFICRPDNENDKAKLAKLTYHKQSYDITLDQIDQLKEKVAALQETPPPYQRMSSNVNAQNLIFSPQNCATFLTGLLGSVGVPVNCGPLGSIVIRPLDIAGSRWAWLADLLKHLAIPTVGVAAATAVIVNTVL